MIKIVFLILAIGSRNIAPNIPALYESHFGVAIAGCVLNLINNKLNASTVSFLLNYSSSATVALDILPVCSFDAHVFFDPASTHSCVTFFC